MSTKRFFGLATTVIGLLLAGQGCSAIILYQSIVSIKDLPLGSSRHQVEAKLGKRVASRPLPDGASRDTYEYVPRDPQAGLKATKMVMLIVPTLGVSELILVPATLYEARKNRRTVTLTFGPDGRLVDYDPPPSYGAVDDSLPGLALSEIRERCRAEHPTGSRDVVAATPGRRLTLSDHLYHGCVVGRLAIWAIE